VHLAEKSETPILADKLYRTHLSSDILLKEATAAIGRHALHAGVLGFEHPITKANHRFEVPPPADFIAALDVLRRVL
jgi:23S rRNA pseudouridine1911/1915/1917 synthase